MDEAEALFFVQEGLYLTGKVLTSATAHDCCLVDVMGMAHPERILVPNTRMEFVSPEDSARVIDSLKTTRGQVRACGCCTPRPSLIKIC